jgi:threonine/homoserine/homoserine lactone efflux protein
VVLLRAWKREIKVSILASAREGFLISILSLKIALFFIALFSQFVALGNDLFNQFVIVATPLIVDGVWYTLITLLLSMPLGYRQNSSESRAD